MIKVDVCVEDVLNRSADVLVSTANPWLNRSGGVNGAIRARCGETIQAELRQYLASIASRMMNCRHRRGEYLTVGATPEQVFVVL